MVNKQQPHDYLLEIIKKTSNKDIVALAQKILEMNWEAISSRNLRRLLRQVSWMVNKVKRQDKKKMMKALRKEASTIHLAFEMENDRIRRLEQAKLAEKKKLSDLLFMSKDLQAKFHTEDPLAEEARLAQVLSLKGKIISLSGGSKKPPLLKHGISYDDWSNSFQEFQRCVKEYKKLAGLHELAELDF